MYTDTQRPALTFSRSLAKFINIRNKIFSLLLVYRFTDLYCMPDPDLQVLSSPPSIPRNAQLLSLGLIILVVLVNYDVLPPLFPPLVYKFLKSILSIDFLLSSSAISLFWDPKTIPIFPLRYLTYPEAGATQLFIRHPYGVESLSIPKSTCGECGFSVQERVP
jgi:hypothetical protein